MSILSRTENEGFSHLGEAKRGSTLAERLILTRVAVLQTVLVWKILFMRSGDRGGKKKSHSMQSI